MHSKIPLEHKQTYKAPAEGSMATLKSSESSFHVLTGTRHSTRDNRSAKTPTQSVQLSKYFRLSSSDQLVGCGLSPDGEDQHSGDSLQKTKRFLQVQRKNVQSGKFTEQREHWHKIFWFWFCYHAKTVRVIRESVWAVCSTWAAAAAVFVDTLMAFSFRPGLDHWLSNGICHHSAT